MEFVVLGLTWSIFVSLLHNVLQLIRQRCRLLSCTPLSSSALCIPSLASTAWVDPLSGRCAPALCLPAGRAGGAGHGDWAGAEGYRPAAHPAGCVDLGPHPTIPASPLLLELQRGQLFGKVVFFRADTSLPSQPTLSMVLASSF